MRTHEIAHKAKNMNPTTLIVHPNPMVLNRRDSIIGKTTPPAEEPELMIPKTVPRFLWKYDVAEVREAVNMAPEPRELTIACESKIW
jgi:hypothetical protein